MRSNGCRPLEATEERAHPPARAAVVNTLQKREVPVVTWAARLPVRSWGAGPRPLTRRRRRSHRGRLDTGHRRQSSSGLDRRLRVPSSLLGCEAAWPAGTESSLLLLGGSPRAGRFSSGTASVGRGFRDEPPGAPGTGSGCRGGSSSWNSLALRGSAALGVMRVLQAVAAGAGS